MALCLCGVCIPLNLVVPFLLGLLHRLGFVEPALEWARRAFGGGGGGGRKKKEEQQQQQEKEGAGTPSAAGASAPSARLRQA